MDEALDNFIKQNGVVFELRAINGDGEVLLKETSEQSFDDVAMFSGLLDERFNKLVVDDVNDTYDDSDDVRSY